MIQEDGVGALVGKTVSKATDTALNDLVNKIQTDPYGAMFAASTLVSTVAKALGPYGIVLGVGAAGMYFKDSIERKIKELLPEKYWSQIPDFATITAPTPTPPTKRPPPKPSTTPSAPAPPEPSTTPSAPSSTPTAPPPPTPGPGVAQRVVKKSTGVSNEQLKLAAQVATVTYSNTAKSLMENAHATYSIGEGVLSGKPLAATTSDAMKISQGEPQGGPLVTTQVTSGALAAILSAALARRGGVGGGGQNMFVAAMYGLVAS